METQKGYSYIINKVSDIKEKLPTITEQQANQLSLLLTKLKTDNHKTEDPLTVNLEKSNSTKLKVKVLAPLYFLEPDWFKEASKKGAPLSALSIGKGLGSRGNRGVNNTGLKLEAQLQADLTKLAKGENVEGLAKAILTVLDIDPVDLAEIEAVGKDAASRALTIQGNRIVFKPGVDKNIGPIVRDIIINTTYGDKFYVSVKKSGTVAYVNAGVRSSILKPKPKGYSDEGLALLTALGIKPDLYDAVFSDKTTIYREHVKNPDVDKVTLRGLINSALGYGFVMAHLKDNGKFECYEQTKEKLDEMAGPITSIDLYYGGIDSPGRRVDIKVSCGSYKYIVSIRSSKGVAGGDFWPTHLYINKG
jgi:hypothetical protein